MTKSETVHFFYSVTVDKQSFVFMCVIVCM